jgi:hypothetical protein
MARTGRPSLYTPELVDLICERVGTHGTGIRNICKMYADMPDPETINEWRYKYEDFSERYLTARKKQSHILFESSLDDVEEIKNFYYEDGKTGATCVDSGVVAAQKALANQKTFLAAKISPKDYGDKQVIETVTTENDELKKELADLRAKLADKAKRDY